MATKATASNRMRIYHRYLGYFLAGVMAVYAVSGMIMIFRDTDFLKSDAPMTRKLAPGLDAKGLGEAIRIRDLKIESQNGEIATFRGGSYNTATGEATWTVKQWPKFVNKLTNLHKANSGSKFFYLNIFFGASLLFFVLSAFWMFMPKTSIFRKGLLFTAAGVVVVLVMLYA